MRIIKTLGRLGAVLGILGVLAASLASAASASTAMIPRPQPDGGFTYTAPSTVTHTVVVGGTPGWQIAVIAVAAALIAAIAAVLLDRARSSRRRLASTPA